MDPSEPPVKALGGRGSLCNRKISINGPSCAALNPFHVQRKQLLQLDEHLRCVAFGQWFVHQSVADVLFASFVLFCHEKKNYVRCLQYAKHARENLKQHDTAPDHEPNNKDLLLMCDWIS